jgi:hypothetical protein
VAGGARARTDQTEFRNRPCRTSLAFCLGRLWSVAPAQRQRGPCLAEGFSASLPVAAERVCGGAGDIGWRAVADRPLFVGIGGEALVELLLEVRAARLVLGWAGGSQLAVVDLGWRRATLDVRDQLGRHSSGRLGPPRPAFQLRRRGSGASSSPGCPSSRSGLQAASIPTEPPAGRAVGLFHAKPEAVVGVSRCGRYGGGPAESAPYGASKAPSLRIVSGQPYFAS